MKKIVAFLKRHPALSPEAFREYYEGSHARIGQAVFPGRARRYVRRYLSPLQHPADGIEGDRDPPFDVIMEIWFADDREMQETLCLFDGTKLGAYVVKDEEYLFDREKIMMFTVDEEETDLVALPRLSMAEAEAMIGLGKDA